MTDERLSDEHLAELMVKVVDSVATPAEREELMQHVVDDPELQAEYENQMALKAVTDGWMSRLEADLAANHDRTNPVRNAERGLGIALFVFGLAVLWGWGVVEAMMNPTTPVPLKVGLGAFSAGSLLLLVHVVRVRFFSGARDPYTEVIR